MRDPYVLFHGVSYRLSRQGEVLLSAHHLDLASQRMVYRQLDRYLLEDGMRLTPSQALSDAVYLYACQRSEAVQLRLL